jgi:hypothetical protein
MKSPSYHEKISESFLGGTTPSPMARIFSKEGDQTSRMGVNVGVGVGLQSMKSL